MKLRTKVILSIIVVMLVVNPTIILIINKRFLPELKKIEDHQITHHTDILSMIVKEEADTLDILVRDWAIWDDSYDFVQNPTQGFIDTNLLDETLANADLSLLMYLDPQAKVVYSKSLDKDVARQLTVQEERHLIQGIPISELVGENNFFSGLVVLQDKPIIIAARPILPSDGTGEAKGVLIMGRHLSKEVVSKWSGYLHADINSYLLHQDLPENYSEVINELVSRGEPLKIEKKDRISGFVLENDIYGNPVLIWETTLDRDIYLRGNSMYAFFILAAVSIGVIGIIAGIAIVDILVIRPIVAIEKGLQTISGKRDFSGRIAVRGGDEISKLVTNINNTLSSLEETRKDLELAYFTVDNAKIGIFWIDRDARIRNINRAVCNSLGYNREELLGMRVFTIDPKYSEESWSQHWEEIKKNGSLTFDSFQTRKDGSRQQVEITANIMEYKGDEFNIAFVRDVADNKTTFEEIRRQAEETQRLNKLMVDRELKMIELKKRINQLEQQLNTQT